MNIFKQLGALRIGMALIVIFMLPFGQFAHTVEPENVYGVLTAFVIPAVTLIFVFVLLLDALMSRVFMAEQDPNTQGHRRTALRLNLLLVFMIALCWYPFYSDLLEL